MDVEAGEEAGGDVGADAEEGLEGFLFEVLERRFVISRVRKDRIGVLGCRREGWCVVWLALTRFRSGKFTPRMKTYALMFR